MEKSKHHTHSSKDPATNNLFERIQSEGWAHIKTIVDVVSEPILILENELRVLAANESFYQKFNVAPEATEKHFIYELGNGQWNIPSLRKHLEDIFSENKHFKGFEVEHEFPIIGRRIMVLNAREIHLSGDPEFKPIILLVIEDVTDIMNIAKFVSTHKNKQNSNLPEHTEHLEEQIEQLLVDMKTLNM